MQLKLYKVTDPEFAEYGQVLEGYDFTSFLQKLKATEQPSDGVVYVPSDSTLESDPAYEELKNRYYGGMPIQIGYCNGVNSTLNALEYHRDSEVDIAAEDSILLLARQADIRDNMLDTASVKAFLQPAGTAVELFATALHYAPCSAAKGAGFHMAIVLPLGTNTDKPVFAPKNHEDTMLTARNKWLLPHPDSNEAKGGAVVGLTGKNITLEEDLW
ncbi:DUF4867 family protein [Ruminococcaceae bacterium OttesenSCG-928-L11]|nr:DUF4867 family protein [Ruminococcaceae bacterium OttesenSCG-928-L11]